MNLDTYTLKVKIVHHHMHFVTDYLKVTLQCIHIAEISVLKSHATILPSSNLKHSESVLVLPNTTASFLLFWMRAGRQRINRGGDCERGSCLRDVWMLQERQFYQNQVTFSCEKNDQKMSQKTFSCGKSCFRFTPDWFCII